MTQGSLHHRSVADLLVEAADGSFTGAIEIENVNVGGAIFLSEGRIYWSRLNGMADVQEILARIGLDESAL